LRIAQDETASPAQRYKASSEVAQQFLPKKIGSKKSPSSKFTADEYGFSVDPNLARELRDTKLKLACLPLSSKRLSPYALAQKAAKLQARIKRIQESLQCPCPSKYRLKYYIGRTGVDAEIIWDGDRLKIFQKRRLDKETFTPEEDLEEAIKTARYDSIVEGPEVAARQRLSKLRELRRAAERGASPLTLAEETTFRFLALLYPLSPRPIDERTLEAHPFHEPPVKEENASGVPVDDLESDHGMSARKYRKPHELGSEERL
jgi:hypothetical protein